MLIVQKSISVEVPIMSRYSPIDWLFLPLFALVLWLSPTCCLLTICSPIGLQGCFSGLLGSQARFFGYWAPAFQSRVGPALAALGHCLWVPRITAKAKTLCIPSRSLAVKSGRQWCLFGTLQLCKGDGFMNLLEGTLLTW